MSRYCSELVYQCIPHKHNVLLTVFFLNLGNNVSQDVSQTFGLDKIESDTFAKPNNITLVITEQESKSDFIEEEEKQPISRALGDNADRSSVYQRIRNDS